MHYYHDYTAECTVVILEALNLATNGPETVNMASHWYELDGHYIPYYVIFRIKNQPVMASILACFPSQFGCFV